MWLQHIFSECSYVKHDLIMEMIESSMKTYVYMQYHSQNMGKSGHFGLMQISIISTTSFSYLFDMLLRRVFLR